MLYEVTGWVAGNVADDKFLAIHSHRQLGRYVVGFVPELLFSFVIKFKSVILLRNVIGTFSRIFSNVIKYYVLYF